MADISVQQKNGGDFTWVWATAAIVAIVGLMAWLFATQDTTSQVVTTTDPAEAAAEPGAETAEAGTEAVELTALSTAPDDYVGREVRVADVSVATALGQRSFWADVPNMNPVLVIVDPAVADVGWLGVPGATVSIEGTVQPVTEEDLDRWIREDVLLPEAGDQAAFATHYLLASQATPS